MAIRKKLILVLPTEEPNQVHLINLRQNLLHLIQGKRQILCQNKLETLFTAEVQVRGQEM
jgi:hypothetical protein